MARPSDPLITAAMAELEREAIRNREAMHLLELLDDLPIQAWVWGALETLSNFHQGHAVKTRPVLLAVLLKELSSLYPVPASLLH
jgi:hypothetical protein